MKRVLCMAFSLLAVAADAQEYPAKVVRIVVPFAAGGSTDVLARMSAQKLNETRGYNLLVDNRPGATGTIGGALVAKSPADGYTLIMHSVSTYIAGYLYRKLSYDAATAFAPIVNCSVNPFYLLSASTLPVKNVAELVALARRRPGELSYGTVGAGSGAHLVSEMFNAAASIKTVAVPYKGSVPAMTALASGEVVFAINNILDGQVFVKQGKMRGLAVTGAKRSPAVPEVPTLLESGVNVEANIWTGLFAPEATPRAIVHKLNEEMARVFSTPESKQFLLTGLGGEFTPNTPEQFAAFLAADTARWQRIIRQIGLQLD